MTPHRRLVEHLSEGSLDGEDRSHAARCRACAVLLAEGGQDVLSPELQAAWLHRAHRELARPLRPWWVLALGVGLGNAILAAAAIAVLGPSNWEVSRSGNGMLVAAMAWLTALAAGGVLLALAPRRRGLGVVLGLAALAPLPVLLTAGGHVASQPLVAGAHCAWAVVLLSALPLAGGAWLLTRVAYSPARAFAVGLASAGVALLVLEMACDGTRPHVLLFHVLPWLAIGAAAVLLRRALPTLSYAP